MATYRLNGPADVGSTGTDTKIYGDVKLQDVGTTLGDTFYVDAAGKLKRLSIGIEGSILSVSSGIPAWSGSVGKIGFSATKSAGSVVTTSEQPVQLWSITSPGAPITTNPYYASSGVFSLAGGVFTPNATGLYNVSLLVLLTNPEVDGSRTISFSQITTGPVYTALLTSGDVQPSPNAVLEQLISLSGSIILESGASYCITAKSTSLTQSQISTKSKFSCTLLSV